MSDIHNIIIIGSGPAGFSAAIYAARAGHNPTLFTGEQPGGQLTITTDVENYPGFAKPINGPLLMEEMKQQAINCGAQIINSIITKVDFNKEIFELQDDRRNIYKTRSVIISTGASARWLGIPSEEKYKGFGVSACATCDGFFYKDKIVAVIGGGNTAVEEALYLANLAQKVILIHRRDELRAEKILQQRLLKNNKIQTIWNSTLQEIVGTEGLLSPSANGIIIKNVLTDEISKLDVDGIFIAIGHTPNTAIFQDFIHMDEHGFILTKNNSTQTNINGVFAAGDVADPIFKQAVTAAATGCMAAIEADKFLQIQNISE